MPPIDQKPKKRQVRRYGAAGRGADTTATPKPQAKVKAKAGPPAPRRVVAPDRADERAARRAEQLKRSVPKTPDQADRKRPEAQKKRDAAVVKTNVRESRLKHLREKGRGSGTRAISRAVSGAVNTMYGPGSPNRSAVVNEREAKKLRAQGKKVKTARIGATIPTQNTILGQYRPLHKSEERARSLAPALKVLEQTMRPVHGVASGSKAALKGESVSKAVGRGLTLKEKTLFTDVLDEAGWKPKSGLGKVARTVVGTTLDVGLDPTTYLTGGTGAVAKQAGRQAAKQAGKKVPQAATRATGTAKEQRRAAARSHGGGAAQPTLAQRAGARAEREADKTRGVVVKFAGKEIPGVRKGTAKASKPIRKVARAVTSKKVRENTRAVGADVNPNIAPAGVARETADAANRATRTARSKSNRGLHEAQQHAVGIKKQIGAANYAKVIDAIEAGKIGSLPSELRAPAIKIRSQFRHANRQRKQAGIKGGERKNYIPHQLTDEAREATGRGRSGVGSRVVRPSSSKARTDQRTLAELRIAEPGKYSDDLPKLYADRKAEGSSAVAKAELNRRVADLGTPVRKGQDIRLGKGESVYHIVGSDMRKVDAKEAAKVADEGGRSGKYVVLNDDLVKRAVEGSKPTLQGPGIVRGYDKVQGGFKKVALFTPGYHVRNLAGDTMNAYLAQSGAKLPKNMVDAGRVLKAEGRRDKGLRKLEKGDVGKGTVKTGRYGKVSYDEVAEQLSRHGAMRSGFTARELPELAGERATLGKVRTPKRLKSALLNREDLPRVSTAIDALRKGATWEEAAEVVNKYHFDYGHLTGFERNVARRIAPFYTFTARNIPLQTKSVIGKPGKYANFQKVREEAERHVGMDDKTRDAKALTEQLKAAGVKLPKGWEGLMSEYEQRNVGIPVSWKGQAFTVSLGFPLADLNEFPGAAGRGQAEEWFKKAMSMVSPLGKNPVEYFNNYSFFFRDQLERDNSPLVPAPKVLSKLPKSVQGDIGLTKIRDKRTGKMVWAWPGKADYIAKMVPGLPAFAVKMSSEGDNRRGQGKVAQALQFAGLRAEPFDPVREATNLAYARMQEIGKEKAKLNQQGVTAETPTAAYRRLLDQEKLLRGIAFQGKKQQGYKVLPKTGGPKVKKDGGFDFDGGGKDFDFSGGGQKFDFG